MRDEMERVADNNTLSKIFQLMTGVGSDVGITAPQGTIPPEQKPDFSFGQQKTYVQTLFRPHINNFNREGKFLKKLSSENNLKVIQKGLVIKLAENNLVRPSAVQVHVV